MSLSELIPLAIKTSIILYLFTLGLEANFNDATYLGRRPGLLVRSLLSMNIIMPLFAATIMASFSFHPAIKIAIIALALSPVPPALPIQTRGGTLSYAISLLVVAALLAIVVIPAGVALVSTVSVKEIHMSAGGVALIVLTTVLAPIVAGIFVNLLAPAVARRVVKPGFVIALALLFVGVVFVLFTQWPMMKSMIGTGAVGMLALFSAVGLAVGHWLGGPEAGNRTVLAVATARRHPGLALAIASANFPDEKAVVAVLCWHLIVGSIFSIPYIIWRKRQQTGAPAATARRV
jgi:bile acid:Na+ symporter, BASS family